MFAAARETGGDRVEQIMLKLVDAVLKKCFYGKFPFDAAFDADFAVALLYCFHHLVPGFEAQPQPVLDNFAGGLVEAINVLRESQTAMFLN